MTQIIQVHLYSQYNNNTGVDEITRPRKFRAARRFDGLTGAAWSLSEAEKIGESAPGIQEMMV